MPASRLHVGTPTSSLSSVFCRKRVLSQCTMESRVGQLFNESSRPNTQHTPTLNAPVFGGQRAKTRGGICSGRVCQEISGELWRRIVALPSAGSVVFTRLQSASVNLLFLSLMTEMALCWFFFLPSRKVVKQHESHDKRREKRCGCSLCVFAQSSTLCC